MPWVTEFDVLGNDYDAFSILNQSKKGENDLKNFAYEIAEFGYNRDGKKAVDHAVASGLMILQYSTYWYWLMKNLPFNPKKLRNFSNLFGYWRLDSEDLRA